MNRHTNWMDKPVTWGAYFKLAGICTIIGSTIAGIGYILLIDPIWWKTVKSFVRRLFDK